MNEIARRCLRLKELERNGDDPEARRELEESLRSKWEGTQVIAGRILARWGGSASGPVLREWLLRACKRHDAGTASIVAEAARCYSRFLNPADAAWVVELYFQLSGSAWSQSGSHPFSLNPLLSRVRPEELVARIIAEVHNSDPAHRKAALEATELIDFLGKVDVLKHLSLDPHKAINGRARGMLHTSGIPHDAGLTNSV